MRKGVADNNALGFFCLAVCLALFTAFSAHAASFGSIALECMAGQGGQAVVFADDEYALTKVASAEVNEASASLFYQVESAFHGVDRDWASLDAAGWRAAAAQVSECARKAGVDPLRSELSNVEGAVFFGGLEPGLYLVERVAAGEAGARFACDPLLVSVPLVEDGAFVYSVVAAPKFEPVDSGKPAPDPGAPGTTPDGFVDRFVNFAKTSDGARMLAAAFAMCAAACVGAVALARRKRRSEKVPAHAASGAVGAAAESRAADAETSVNGEASVR